MGGGQASYRDCFEKRKKPRRMTTGVSWDNGHGRGINTKRKRKLKYADDYDKAGGLNV